MIASKDQKGEAAKTREETDCRLEVASPQSRAVSQSHNQLRRRKRRKQRWRARRLEPKGPLEIKPNRRGYRGASEQQLKRHPRRIQRHRIIRGLFLPWFRRRIWLSLQAIVCTRTRTQSWLWREDSKEWPAGSPTSDRTSHCQPRRSTWSAAPVVLQSTSLNSQLQWGPRNQRYTMLTLCQMVRRASLQMRTWKTFSPRDPPWLGKLPQRVISTCWDNFLMMASKMVPSDLESPEAPNKTSTRAFN